MADLIASSIVTTTVTAGGVTRLQVFGGNPGNQWLVCDFELTAAQSASLSGGLVTTPLFFVGNQTVDLSAANNTSYTTLNTANKPLVGNVVAGDYITIATAAGALPNTVLSVVSVTNNTTLRVTYVSGANAANVTSGDIFTITSPATSASTTINQAQMNAPQNGISNAI